MEQHILTPPDRCCASPSSRGLKQKSRDPLDAFYTCNSVVNACMTAYCDHVPIEEDLATGCQDAMIIEPSAGDGAFIPAIKLLCKAYGHSSIFLDIDPHHEDIQKQDFLTWQPSFPSCRDAPPPLHVLGNPPFGRQSSLARKFIAHACTWAASISFILPASFKKESMQKCFAPNFHCVYQCDVNQFRKKENGVDILLTIPCVFQIWIRKESPRPAPSAILPVGYAFVKKTATPDVAIRRVGVYAGRADTVIDDKNEQSHYFIRFKKRSSPRRVKLQVERWNTIHYPTAGHTVGARSLGKGELVKELNANLIR